MLWNSLKHLKIHIKLLINKGFNLNSIVSYMHIPSILVILALAYLSRSNKHWLALMGSQREWRRVDSHRLMLHMTLDNSGQVLPSMLLAWSNEEENDSLTESEQFLVDRCTHSSVSWNLLQGKVNIDFNRLQWFWLRSQNKI